MGIAKMLLGILSLLCLFSLQPGLSAEVTPLSQLEPFYPDCLSNVREFHESFLDSPTRAMESNCFEQNALYANYGIDSIYNSEHGEPLSTLSGGNGFKDLTAINTVDHRSTEKQMTYVLSNQPTSGSGPDGVNAMDIEVAHITVIAINFARGGSAVATSDIFLEPNQDQGVR